MAGENQQEKKRLGAMYALALYELATEQGSLETVLGELQAWKTLLQQEPKLIDLFESVVIPTDERERMLQSFGQGLSPVMANFLSVLNRRGRLGVLPEIIEAFSQEDDRRNNRVRVKVSTAVSVDGHLMDDLKRVLKKYLKGEPMIEHQVRPEILGGFIAHAGDLLIDGSVKTRLKAMEKSLLIRGEDEIQSGRDFISHQA